MKKLLNLALAVLFLGLMSCNDKDEPIWDYNPYVLNIDIVDADGNNLLDPAVEGNIAGESILMGYNDLFYEMLTPDTDNSPNRYYLPTFFGLVRQCGWDYETSTPTSWQLRWGEFDCAVSKTYNFDLYITCINRAPFSFELKITNKGNGEVYEELSVDGKKVDTPNHYTIVL